MVKRCCATRGYYFGAGPTMLPEPVHQRFAERKIDLGHEAFKLYEVSHRSPSVCSEIDGMLTKFRSLCAVPANYEVLLCVGGARHLYEMLPLNVPQALSMSVLNTGLWSALWAETISMLRVCTSMPVSVFGKDGYAPGNMGCLDNAVLCCVTNETADGICLPEYLLPRAAYTVADLTSDLGFRQIDLSRYDCAFASSGKAFGVSGMTIVVISPGFLQQLRSDLLPLQSLQKIAQHRSMYTTPSLICLDVFGHMLDWLIAEGGMSAVTLRQRRRSALIYERLAQFSVYRVTVPVEFRSIHNICFDLRSQSVQVFLAEANARGLFGLKGHKKVGGIRISLTHGVSAEGFNQLLTFLDDFGRRYSE